MRHSNHWKPKHVKQRKFNSHIVFYSIELTRVIRHFVYVCLFDHVQTATLC